MDISGIDHIGLDRVMKRGSGEIIAEQADALLIRDRVSGAYLLACEDAGIGLPLLDRYCGQDCGLLTVSNYSLGKAAFERFGFSGKLECYQVAYYGDKPSIRDGLRVRTDAWIASVQESGELEKIVRRNGILLGYEQDRLVGFVGEHLEGSMGLLYIFPEYRHRGFGAALQTRQIAKTMENGFIPFGQVEKDNHASMELQKKLGMTQSDRLIVWMWK